MSIDEAPAAQVNERNRKRFFRVDGDAKANMQPPAEAATWFQIISITLGNADEEGPSDSIGVVTSWKLPGVFAGTSLNTVMVVQTKIASGVWGADIRSADWAGHAIAESLGLDASDKLQKERIKQLLKAWLDSGALKLQNRPSQTTPNRTREIVVVGKLVEEESTNDET